MTTKITIIGMGQIGTSIGLALENYKETYLRIGHDIEVSYANKAKKMGAVDKVVLNLFSAIRNVDIVLLALPIDQVRETLELIGEELREGTVVLDTSPIRDAPTKWADELLPETVQYAGFTPLLSPLYLHEEGGGIENAHPDLFDHGLIAITSSPNIASSAPNTAAKLAKYLKATPLFAEKLEVDSYMAALHVIPQLISSVLSKTTTHSSGWQEGRKFAGKPYAQVTNPIASQDNPTGLASAAVLNKDNTLRILDDILKELQNLRNEIEKEDLEAIEKYLTQAREGREKWWAERGAANWAGVNFPKLDDDLGGFKPFGRFRTKRKKREKRGS